MKSTLAISAFVLLALTQVHAQKSYKVCARSGSGPDCNTIERGDSVVTCGQVSGNTDCLGQMLKGDVHFAVLTPEETILAAKINNDAFDIIGSVRNVEKSESNYAFQSVAVVKKGHTNGISGLKGGRFCHPGYGKAKEQLWSSRVLKHFEKTVANSVGECKTDSKSSAEDDAIALTGFFAEACRPGLWLPDLAEDRKLKDKYPTLCTLCNSNSAPNCDGYRYFDPKSTGETTSYNGHLSAVSCLVNGKGTVAYVAYSHLLEFFSESGDSNDISDFLLLCPNGTTTTFNPKTNGTEAPCSWINQPWGTLIARKDVSSELYTLFKQWMPSGRPQSGTDKWIVGLANILFRDGDSILRYEKNITSPASYVTKGRPLPESETNPCHKPMKWCTVNDGEQNMCKWVQEASLTLGIEPEIECVRGKDKLDCMSMIKVDRADFTSIDTNLGFLGRKYYNITTSIYEEMNKQNASKIYALIKESQKGEINRFENLKDKTACFPEFGGSAWVAAVRTLQERRVFNTRECDYAVQIINFFKGVCAPGAADPAHHPSKAADPAKLCSACKLFTPYNINEEGIQSNNIESPETMCPADPSNVVYGNKGALNCLSGPDANVAFLEVQNLEAHAAALKLDPNQFRILCRNGSLAAVTGFQVDEDCALAAIIDSEVIRKRGFSDSLNLQFLLQELDNSYGYSNGISSLIDFHIFSAFNNTENLLFKDITTGFATRDSDNRFVKNYVELFQHTETCTGGAGSLISSMFILFVSLITICVL